MPTILLLAPWIFRPSTGSGSYSSHTPGIAKDLSWARQEQLFLSQNYIFGILQTIDILKCVLKISSLFITDVAFVKFSL